MTMTIIRVGTYQHRDMAIRIDREDLPGIAKKLEGDSRLSHVCIVDDMIVAEVDEQVFLNPSTEWKIA